MEESELRMIIRMCEVHKILGCSRAQTYKMQAAGLLPKSRRLGARAVGIRMSDLTAMIDFIFEGSEEKSDEQIREFIASLEA